ncbi:MAG: non-homologous end-joining DNA ligase [Deltaproteobacteria bacterium]|nr:non-homologous end-joining DNA ligase [Deltaproteobacteria bacterium]
MKSSLAKYRAKRDFTATPEPRGAARVAAGHRFVIQQHAARRMHYDFRLEHGGALLSWAVPKGPSLSPKEKRLAVRVEDHPIDYADFEGIIPEGQYGGGTVSVWDRGEWRPEGDPDDGLRRGRLTFTLVGEKLHGRWHLVRTKGQARKGKAADSWLLFKSRDDAANENLDITQAEPRSVVSGRTLDEIAGDADRVWSSNRPEDVANIVRQLPVGFAFTNLDKVLYPEQGTTKAQLVAYLAVIAEWMLPHVAGRPLTLVRCPDGRAKPCFYQKKLLPGSPSAVHTFDFEDGDGGVADYMYIEDLPGLVALAQLGTLEVHTWGCHAKTLEQPDLMVLDLDPDTRVPWERVALGAFELRRRLGELGLTSFLKTTGGKGLHVVVPFARGPSWDQLKGFAKRVVDDMAAAEPRLYTTNMAKSARHNRIFLDYLRNGRTATFIAPYSPRARAGAAVALPVDWKDLAHGIDPLAFTMASVPAIVAARGADPWGRITKLRQKLPL